MKAIKVLIIVKDNPVYIKSLINDYHVDIVDTVQKGINICKNKQYDAILLDPVLPNGKGLEVYEKIHEHCNFTPIIIISNNENMTLELINAGAQDCHTRTELTKTQLSKSIQYAIKRKEIECKLRKEKNNNKMLYNTLITLLNCMDDIIWSKNKHHKYDIVNNSFLKTVDMKENEIIGKTVQEIFEHDNYDILESDNIVMETRKSCKCVEKVFLNNGRNLWWDVIKSPIFDNNNNIIGIAGTARDITDKVKAEERIKIKLDKNIQLWKEEQSKNMSEIRESISNTIKQINDHKDILDEQNRR